MTAHLFDWMQSATTAPAQFLITGLWQGIPLAACAALLLKLSPKMRASVRFQVWMTVFLVLAPLPFLALSRGGPAGLSVSAAHPAFAGAYGFAWRLNPGWAWAIDAVWIPASLLSLAALLADAFKVRSLARSAECVPPESLPGELRVILFPTRGRRARICLSDRVDVPSVLGFFHPAILIPKRLWTTLSPAERMQIVTHEMAHLRRADDWTNLLQRTLRALLPLNPALYWIDRQLCLERERACDQAVLDAAVSPRAYASCLTRIAEKGIAEKKLRRPSPALAPGAWRRRSELVRRVHGILEAGRTLGPMGSRAVAACSLTVVLGAALTLARCPRLVSFAPAAPSTLETSAAIGRPAIPRPRTARYETASLRFTAHRRPRASRPALRRAARLSPNTPGETMIVFTLWRPSPELPTLTLWNGSAAPTPLLYRFYVLQI